MSNSGEKLTISDVFEWGLLALIVGGGVWVSLSLLSFVYKLFAGTYHLLDKLIDHL